jgi:KaiC/GvpD/RAD55 family RecA-like ATPase
MAKKKDTVLKEFLNLPGVGMSKAKAIYEAGFDSMEKLSDAKVDDLAEIKGIPKNLANEIHKHFHEDEKPEKKPKKGKKSDEDILLEKGLALYKKGKWGQALQIITDVLEKDPENEQALLYKGDIYLEREKYSLAIEAYEVLIDNDTEEVGAWVGYGEALWALERQSEARAYFKKAYELNPDNEIAKERLAVDERLPTYVGGLDEILEGGIPQRHVILICGRAGSMKSSFAYYILHKLSENEGRKAIYLTLEQSRDSLMRHMKKLGLSRETASTMMVSDLDDMVVIDMGRLRKETDTELIGSIDWLNSIVTQIENYRKTFGCEIVAVDSLSALYSLTTFKNPRSELFFFFEKLRDLDITVLLISEMFDPDKELFGQHGVEEFLADGIIHLKTEKYGNRTNLFLGVAKMRETNHERDYFPLIVDKSGFDIVRD